MERVKKESLKAKIEAIAKNYFTAERHIRSHICGFASCDEVGLTAYQNYVERVICAYDNLNEEEKNIINNEYFYQDYPNWWKSLYTRSSFAYKKRSAMKRFLSYFYE